MLDSSFYCAETAGASNSFFGIEATLCEEYIVLKVIRVFSRIMALSPRKLTQSTRPFLAFSPLGRCCRRTVHTTVEVVLKLRSTSFAPLDRRFEGDSPGEPILLNVFGLFVFSLDKIQQVRSCSV